MGIPGGPRQLAVISHTLLHATLSSFCGLADLFCRQLGWGVEVGGEGSTHPIGQHHPALQPHQHVSGKILEDGGEEEGEFCRIRPGKKDEMFLLFVVLFHLSITGVKCEAASGLGGRVCFAGGHEILVCLCYVRGVRAVADSNHSVDFALGLEVLPGASRGTPQNEFETQVPALPGLGGVKGGCVRACTDGGHWCLYGGDWDCGMHTFILINTLT